MIFKDIFTIHTQRNTYTYICNILKGEMENHFSASDYIWLYIVTYVYVTEILYPNKSLTFI